LRPGTVLIFATSRGLLQVILIIKFSSHPSLPKRGIMKKVLPKRDYELYLCQYLPSPCTKVYYNLKNEVNKKSKTHYEYHIGD
jgi:hypothetical protein